MPDKKNILIVDDDAQLAKALQVRCEKEFEVTVRTCMDGLQATIQGGQDGLQRTADGRILRQAHDGLAQGVELIHRWIGGQ